MSSSKEEQQKPYSSVARNYGARDDDVDEKDLVISHRFNKICCEIYCINWRESRRGNELRDGEREKGSRIEGGEFLNEMKEK